MYYSSAYNKIISLSQKLVSSIIAMNLTPLKQNNATAYNTDSRSSGASRYLKPA
jgi:hypothetical protein